jgi:hypothetical protein
MDLIFHNGRLLIPWDLRAIIIFWLAIKRVKLGWILPSPLLGLLYIHNLWKFCGLS